ncbi:MAG: SDR family oxidoreductase [Myxococcales bacterium]|nr:SDR family oxidoreductase [Myxococcales bacterium]
MPTVLITGANRGIGLALARRYHERGDTVIAACRDSSKALDALGVRVETGVELTDDDQTPLARRLEGTPIDVLVCNAGILRQSTLDALDLQSIREQFEVNTLGPLKLVAALRDQLPRGAKVALITSRMGSIADNTSGGSYGYRMSKAALNMAGASLAHDLRRAGVAVVLLHPGYVKTDMTGNSGDATPDEAARGLIARIDELSMETSGSFHHARGEELPW